MHLFKDFILIIMVICFQGQLAYSQNFVPTFNCISIYWSPDVGSTSNKCQVRYRKKNHLNWREAMPLWFDERSSEYKGSILDLESGVEYEVQLRLANDSSTVNGFVTTWSEIFPIAEVVYLDGLSNKTYTIDKSGDPQGYILYTSAKDTRSTIDINNTQDYGIRVADNTSYVIIRDIIITGPSVHGIYIGKKSSDIVIEGNDISNWGSANAEGWAINYHSAVYAKSPDIKRIIIQRNKFHHPRADANSWDEFRVDKQTYHPGGAHAVCFVNTFGNHVIRYNEIFSDEDHYFCDGLGGSSDYSFEGFPNKDSDIYGNIISHCWDDGIESEGGNQNVRIWGNYIDKTYVKIAIAATSSGPLYIYRNVANTSRRSGLEPDSDLYGRGPFIKCGGRVREQEIWYGGGRTYLFHNTVLQTALEEKRFTLGGSSAILSSGGELYNMISRNNIFLTYKPTGSVIIDKTNSCTNDFDNDLYNGHIKNQCIEHPHQQNGVRLMKNQLPKFQIDDQSYQYTLQPQSLGFDMAVPIPNINDNYHGTAPDIGAFEYGAESLEFGVDAYSKN